MCGRYYIDVDMAEIKRILRKIDAANRNNIQYHTGEIYPTHIVPVITAEESERLYNLMMWGFPKYNAKGVIINARSENAAQKPMFAKSLRARRCVIPVSGFFEWQKKDSTKPKDKFFFSSNQEPVMYMAGIRNRYQGDETDRFAILTRDANISIADIHDRMPVVLHENEVDDWLSDEQFVNFVLNRSDVVLKRSAV